MLKMKHRVIVNDIITLNQSDTFEKDGIVVRMIPASEFIEK